MIQRIKKISEKLNERGVRSVALWGAGKFGQKWFSACSALMPPIRLVLDDSPSISCIGNVPVAQPTAQALSLDIDAVVVACDVQLVCAIRKRLFDFPAFRKKPVFYLALSEDQHRLLELKDKHAGETIFLLGNGPSVQPHDIDRLAGRTVFCCNKFYKAYDLTALRPPYVVSADRQMIEDFGAEITRRSNGRVFFAMEERPVVTGDFIWIPAHNHGVPLLDESLLYKEASICSASLIIALQIAWWMGGRHFVLYGVDHSFHYEPLQDSRDRLRNVMGEGNHFIENYRDGRPWCAPRTDIIEAGWEAADRMLRKQGGWIKNATRGGNLNILERIDFDAAL